MIDIRRLRTFIYVAQSMSFSAAALHLHLTQPTVSHHIKLLERDLGVKLFERSAHGLTLTSAGHLLLPQARKLVRDTISIKQMMEAFDEQVVGHLNIVCSTTAGKYITPQLAGRFHRQHPQVSISVLKCTVGHVVPSLLGGEADIGIVSYDACDDTMECCEFFSDHIILIAPRDHLWASREMIDSSELVGVPMIIREPTSGTHHAMLAALGMHDIVIDDLNVFLEVSNAEAIVKSVEAGFGVAFVSRLAAAWALGNRTIIEVPVDGIELHRKLYLIRPAVHEENRALDAFWGFVHDPCNADLLALAER